MKKLFFLYCIISSLVATTYRASACASGPYGWWDRPQHLFISELLSDTTYSSYFEYSSYYGGDNFDAVPEAMVQEWKTKFPQATSVDIQRALFSFNESSLLLLKNGQNPIQGNTFYAALLTANPSYLDYLRFVLDENSANVPPENDWEAPTRDITQLKNLLSIALDYVETLKDDGFLKQKYAFQIVKIQHQMGAYADAIKSFDKYTVSGEKSLSYFRAMGYKAGSLRRTGDTAQAKILFARVFDQCPPLRLMALRNFKYIDLSADKYLKLVNSEAEKSAIFMMQYIGEDTRDFTALEALYISDPSSSRLELITLKEMNAIHLDYLYKLRDPFHADTNLLVKDPKLEACASEEIAAQISASEGKGWFARVWEAIVNFFKKIFGTADSARTDKQADSTSKKNPELKLPFFLEEEWVGEYKDLLEKINKENKVKNKDLFRTALAYSYMISGHFEQANAIFTELSYSKNLKLAQLNEYLGLWSDLVGHEKIRPEFEDKFTDYHRKYSTAKEPEHAIRISDLQKELSRRYLVEQQYIKALLVHDPDYESDMLQAYYTCDMLDSLERFIQQKHSTKLEIYFKAPELAKITKHKTQRLIKMGLFKEAAQKDPQFTFTAYNKNLDVNMEIGTLQQLISWQEKDNAESYAKIADVIANADFWDYNSYPWGRWKGYSPSFGNIDTYYKTEITASYPFNVKGLAETYLNRTYQESMRSNSVALAEAYYLKAISKSTDDEFKAQMYFKAQALKIKSLHNIDAQSDYYAVLKNQYAHTKFYQDMYNSCSFLRLGKVINYSYY